MFGFEDYGSGLSFSNRLLLLSGLCFRADSAMTSLGSEMEIALSRSKNSLSYLLF